MSTLSAFKKLVILSAMIASVMAAIPASQAWSQSSVRVKKKKARAKPAESQDIIVPVPQSRLNFSSAPEPEPARKMPHWEVAASNWAPSALTESSYLNDAGNFQRANVPMLSVNLSRGEGNALGASFKWTPKYGLSYSQLSRKATVQLSTVAVPVSQTMNVFSARLGVEVTPQKDLFGFVRPFVDVSALPSFAVTGSSEISDGGSRGLFAIEEVAGVSLQAPVIASIFGLNNIGLELGLQATQGAGESSLSGVGVLAGTRIDL